MVRGAVVGKSPVSDLASHWIEGWLLPGLMSFKLKKKKKKKKTQENEMTINNSKYVTVASRLKYDCDLPGFYGNSFNSA